MKKRFLIYSIAAILIFPPLCLFSQPTPKTREEIEAYMKVLKKKADSLQAAMKKKNNNGKTRNLSDTNKKSLVSKKTKNIEEQNLPEFDSIKARSLPKKTFTPAELNSYLTNLYKELSRKFPADAVASANSIAQKLNNSPVKLEAAALHAWQNGADEESILLIVKGAANGGDGLVLTNAGGILDINDLSEKAIPILRTVTSYSPRNVIALNNLGQAYTALGMRDSAMIYFSRCLSLSPQHPEANNTAGYIELKKGNKEKAQSYFENSIRGSFNLAAAIGLSIIFKDDKSKLKIAHLLKPKIKKPEYFNQFKYNNLPRQCLNVGEAATVRDEFNAFNKMMDKERRKFILLAKEAEESMGKNWAADLNKKTMDAISQGKSYMKPFQAMGSIVEAELGLGYREDKAGLEKFNKENREQYEKLEKEFKAAMEQLARSTGGDLCHKENELKNKFLPVFAQLNQELQSRNMLIENKYIDDLLYWCYFSAYDNNDYRHQFYTHANSYLSQVEYLAQVYILEPCKETEPKEIEQPQAGELKEFDCPASLQLSLVVGKLNVDCEKISFKAGEGLVFKYEKRFTGKRQSTISIGAGGGVDLTQKFGPIKAGLEAGMDMSVYFTFDKSGNCTDAGMKFSAYRGMGVDFSAGQRLKIDRNLGYMEEKIGWRFGVNSGVSFDVPDNPFMKEKPEVPINKNVKIYQGQ
ncbi:MAG: hypothetical protein JST10_06185 [Bacteroidetes bacterium]|nr:hypothetical protein [Bacteroidota bacterium]MBS1632147.1 hypothetical protein [Bacteroidota bacterium]